MRLQPTYAIWLLGQTLRPGIAEAIHCFRLRDDQGRSLLEHGGIWLLELSKCRIERVETERDRWLKFFIEGDRLDADHLPAWMQTEEMRQAMNTLKAFSEKERAYHEYQARQNYLRQQQSLENHLNALRAEAEQARAAKEQARAEAEQERAAKEQERAAKEQERAAKEAALAEIERLKALLGK
jgi:flagellar biosynthesis GTPase FlhF